MHQRFDRKTIINLMREARRAGATDIHLKVPGRPRLRVGGRLIETPYPQLQPSDTQAAARSLLELAGLERATDLAQELEFGVGVVDVGRFRVHLYKQRGTIGLVLHRMALSPPTMSDLGVHEELCKAVLDGPGLVLVAAGASRVPMLALLTQRYNLTTPGHLISLEDPLEYLFRDRKAAISQREVGVDTESFRRGLAAAEREDPDVIVLHDIPDCETAERAIRFAEGGRMVLAGLACARMPRAEAWLATLFPPRRERELQTRMSSCLRMVVGEHAGRIVYRTGREAELAAS